MPSAIRYRRDPRVPLCCLLAAALPVALPAELSAQGRNITHKSKEGVIKTNAPKEAAVDFGTRIDRYVELFDAFYEPLELKKKNNNRIIVRLMATQEEFDEFWARNHSGNPPAAFFSPSLNALVLYNDPDDPQLRQTLFHEASHQYLNRYTYDAPKWFNEGLAEYFEGWWIPETGEPEKRPALFDLMVIQDAIRTDNYMPLSRLCNLTREEFNDFDEKFPKLHHYLHYATSWSFTYYCLHGPSEEDKELWVDFMRQVNKLGPRAKFEPPDWDALEARWKKWIMTLDPERKIVDDFLLVASAYRQAGEYEKAFEEYERLLAKFPDAKDKALFWMGFCLKRQGYYDEASKYLKRAQEVDPTDPRPPYYLARIILGVDLRDPEPVSEEVAARGLELAQLAADNSTAERYHYFLAERQAAAGDSRSVVKTMNRLIKGADDKDDKKYYQEKLKELKALARKARSGR